VREVAAILAAFQDVLPIALELENETYHGTQNPELKHHLAALARAAREAGFRGPIAPGAPEVDEVARDGSWPQSGLLGQGGADHYAVHLDRGRTPGYRNYCRTRELALIPGGVNNQEPKRIDDMDDPVSAAFILGALSPAFNVASVLHSTGLREANAPLGGVELAGLEAYSEAHRLVAPHGPFDFSNTRRTDADGSVQWSNSPIFNGAFEEGANVLPGGHLWRAYAFRGGRSLAVTAGARPRDPGAQQWANGVSAQVIAERSQARIYALSGW
jgi:hypothetical protein